MDELGSLADSSMFKAKNMDEMMIWGNSSMKKAKYVDEFGEWGYIRVFISWHVLRTWLIPYKSSLDEIPIHENKSMIRE